MLNLQKKSLIAYLIWEKCNKWTFYAIWFSLNWWFQKFHLPNEHNYEITNLECILKAEQKLDIFWFRNINSDKILQLLHIKTFDLIKKQKQKNRY